MRYLLGVKIKEPEGDQVKGGVYELTKADMLTENYHEYFVIEATSLESAIEQFNSGKIEDEWNKDREAYDLKIDAKGFFKEFYGDVISELLSNFREQREDRWGYFQDVENVYRISFKDWVEYELHNAKWFDDSDTEPDWAKWIAHLEEANNLLVEA